MSVRSKVYGVILGVAAALAMLPRPAVADAGCGGKNRDPRVIRVVVIGGMTREVDLWSAITQKFEEKTGYRVELVDTGISTPNGPKAFEGPSGAEAQQVDHHLAQIPFVDKG